MTAASSERPADRKARLTVASTLGGDLREPGVETATEAEGVGRNDLGGLEGSPLGASPVVETRADAARKGGDQQDLAPVSLQFPDDPCEDRDRREGIGKHVCPVY